MCPPPETIKAESPYTRHHDGAVGHREHALEPQALLPNVLACVQHRHRSSSYNATAATQPTFVQLESLGPRLHTPRPLSCPQPGLHPKLWTSHVVRHVTAIVNHAGGTAALDQLESSNATQTPGHTYLLWVLDSLTDSTHGLHPTYLGACLIHQLSTTHTMHTHTQYTHVATQTQCFLDTCFLDTKPLCITQKRPHLAACWIRQRCTAREPHEAGSPAHCWSGGDSRPPPPPRGREPTRAIKKKKRAC